MWKVSVLFVVFGVLLHVNGAPMEDLTYKKESVEEITTQPSVPTTSKENVSFGSFEDSGSIEMPVRPKKINSGSTGFSPLQPNDDAVFNFVKKLVNTAQLSSKMAVNRIQKFNDQRKMFTDNLGEIIDEVSENSKSPKIPFFDGFSRINIPFMN